jgi:hypothetical protein
VGDGVGDGIGEGVILGVRVMLGVGVRPKNGGWYWHAARETAIHSQTKSRLGFIATLIMLK